MDVTDNSEYFCIKCFIEGDEEAFVVLYNKYHRHIYYSAFKMTQSKEIAKDVTQDVFLKLWETRNIINPNQNFAAYIHVICRNIIFNLYKKATIEENIKKELQQFSDVLESENEDNDFYETYKALLDKAIAELPPQRRMVFELCKLEKNTYDEAASRLSISRSTVHDHIVKANKFINEYLLKKGNISFALLFSILNQLVK